MKNMEILMPPVVYLMSFHPMEFLVSIVIRIILMFGLKFSYIKILEENIIEF